jgi:hypothetical protein
MNKITSTEAPTKEYVGAPATNALIRSVGDNATCRLAVHKESNVGLPHWMCGVAVKGTINGINVCKRFQGDFDDVLVPPALGAGMAGTSNCFIKTLLETDG